MVQYPQQIVVTYKGHIVDAKNFKILKLLSARGLRQEDLAEKTFIDRGRISRIINKRLPVPNENEKMKIAEALKCKTEEIFQ